MKQKSFTNVTVSYKTYLLKLEEFCFLVCVVCVCVYSYVIYT